MISVVSHCKCMLRDWLGHQIIVSVAKVMIELLKNSVYIATRYNYLKYLFSCAEYMTEKYNIKEVLYCLELRPVSYKRLVSFSGWGKQHYNKNKRWVLN